MQEKWRLVNLMSTTDINLGNVTQIAKTLQTLDWKWQKDEWPGIASQLNLAFVEKVLTRESYSFINRRDLSVHFSDSGFELDFISIDLAVFIDIEFLDADEYDEKMDEFERLYQDCLDNLNLQLGSSDLVVDIDEHDAIQGHGWRMHNASVLLLLFSQGDDVPIILSIHVVPPIFDENHQ